MRSDCEKNLINRRDCHPDLFGYLRADISGNFMDPVNAKTSENEKNLLRDHEICM